MKIELPEKVKTVIAELKAHGYDAYAVGGCIRDSILGRTPGAGVLRHLPNRIRGRRIFHGPGTPGSSMVP